MFQNGLKNKDIDLLKVYKQKKEASPYVGTLKYLVFPIGAAVILISWFDIVTYQNHALDSDIAAAKAELKQVQKQIAEDPNLEKYQSLQKAMNDVEKYKGCSLKIAEENLTDLDDGEFYYHEIIGLDVYEGNTLIGQVKEILQPGANDVWVVKRKGKKDLLLPYIPPVVLDVDVAAGRIEVELMEGLDDED